MSNSTITKKRTANARPYSKKRSDVSANHSSTMIARVAFPGEIGQALEQCLRDDAQNWNINWKFRCYYKLRSWIPLALRQSLQRNRNSTLPVGDDWYCHAGFLNRLRSILESSALDSQPIIHPWPDGYSHAIVMTHDIETRVGVERVSKLADLDEQYGLRSAWYFVPSKYRIDSGLLDDLRSRGHEIGLHGYNHDGQLFFSKQRFNQRAHLINSAGRDWNCSGFRSPMMHRELNWMQALDIDYDSSCFDVDPYQAMPGGVGGVWPFLYGRFVELPSTMPQDHTLFVTLQQQSIDIWRKKYELIRQLRGLALCITHPDYFDSAKRWDLYRALLEQLSETQDAWRCLPREAARWWRARDASQATAGAIGGPAAERGQTTNLPELFAEFQT